MVFAISANAQTPCFDSGKTEPDGFAECRSINMGDLVLVANSAVRKIETLAWYIPIRVRCVVGGQPEWGKCEKRNARREAPDRPSLNENLLRSVRSTGCSGNPYIGRQLLQGMIGTDGHSAENAWRLSRFLMISGHWLAVPIHGRIV